MNRRYIIRKPQPANLIQTVELLIQLSGDCRLTSKHFNISLRQESIITEFRRIQSCIQRFRSRRRLNSELSLYFNEYLFLGGVDASPAAFTGQDSHELKDMTPAERREATATDTIHGGSTGSARFYNGDRDHWSVDFKGVAAGFFSLSLGPLTGYEDELMKKLLTWWKIFYATSCNTMSVLSTRKT